MPINIKDEEADTLARRLASLTGETLTAAVTTAIRERLDRLERQRSADRMVDDVRAISAKFLKHVTEPVSSLDHGELLYDERGLPK